MKKIVDILKTFIQVTVALNELYWEKLLIFSLTFIKHL